MQMQMQTETWPANLLVRDENQIDNEMQQGESIACCENEMKKKIGKTRFINHIEHDNKL